MAKKRRGSFLGKLLGAAAVAGAATAISKLEKQAKEEGKDILDVAKEKADGVVESIKSGEALEKAQDLAEKAQGFAEKTVNDINSGEFADNLKNKLNETVESVKSGEALEKAKDTVANVRDGVVDLFDGKPENVMDVVEDKVEETIKDVEEKLEDVVNKE